MAGLANASTSAATTSTAAAKPPYNFGSGYSAINGTCTSVSVNWTQPAATCRGGDQQTGFWVGLSGSGTIPGSWTFTGAGRLDDVALGRPVSSNSSLENGDWGRSRLTDGLLTSVAGVKEHTSDDFPSPDLSTNPVGCGSSEGKG
ncbi:hypothetical protein [Streptomyces camelliae]|uniref:Uncharacterized protein n=1 Tax=Streptomyces camelliae TaxID=3004093 RepID=A0ABY7NWU9_9ACTN|nr:hypothetical protein [Streptomyces sp. HUAS 2-6]WBO61729.1 hypothetical protein O1G22_02085 [Streptomyces sp. HUAS 2-6]